MMGMRFRVFSIDGSGLDWIRGIQGVTTPLASETMFASTLASIVIVAMMNAYHAVSRIYGISRVMT